MLLSKLKINQAIFTVKFIPFLLAILAMPVTSTQSQEPISASTPPFLTKWQAVTRKNPVFQGSGGENWDAKIRERGWIIRSGNEWRLYYTGYNTSNSAKTDLRRLGLAVSNDGLNWTRAGEQPIVDDQWIEDLSIVQHKGLWIMVAEGRDDIAHSFTSKDGLKWEREGPLDIRMTNGEPIAAGPRGTPFLMHENGEWWLFYERGDLGVWLAKSGDRKVWKNVSDDPVIALGPDAYDKGGIALNQILKVNGVYYAVLHANQTRPFNGYWTTTLARSTDLLHWEKIKENPIVANNSSSGQIISMGSGRWRLYTMHPEVRVFESGEK